MCWICWGMDGIQQGRETFQRLMAKPRGVGKALEAQWSQGLSNWKILRKDWVVLQEIYMKRHAELFTKWKKIPIAMQEWNLNLHGSLYVVSSVKKASILIQLYKYPFILLDGPMSAYVWLPYHYTWLSLGSHTLVLHCSELQSHVQCRALVTVVTASSGKVLKCFAWVSLQQSHPMLSLYTKGVFSLSVFQQLMFPLPTKSISLKLCSATE